MLKRRLICFLLLCFFVTPLGGCMRLALRTSPSLLPSFTETIFEECDPTLAQNAVPAHLKLMEGILKNDPGNQQILTLLSMGFSGYSLLFLESQDPERAARFYHRAVDYGMRALGDKGKVLKDPGTKPDQIQKTLKAIGRSDLESLFWTTVSLNAWIVLNLDKPTALAQLNLSEACVERILQLDPKYFYGFPYILKGVILAARPKMYGGNMKEAKNYFDKGLAVGKRQFYMAQYYYAKYYTVRAQDKELFFKLIEEINDGDPRDLKDVCLVNTIIQQKAKELKEMADELFF